jgi:hypothetical protein
MGRKAVVASSEPLDQNNTEMTKEDPIDMNADLEESTVPVTPAPTEESIPDSYETDVALPTKGLVYDNIPAVIRIRAMTTEDEKIIFASSSSNMLKRVVSRCIVSPKNLNVEDLLACDEQYIMLKLREFTYGSDYHIVGICPKCGQEHEFTIDLSSYKLTELDDDFQEPIEMTLPMSKHVLQVKLLRNKDYTLINEQAQKHAKKSTSTVSELEYIYRMAKSIVTIDGKDAQNPSTQTFVKKMHGRDAAYYWFILNKSFKCGLETTTQVKCPGCDEVFDLPFEINSEFFRPKFEF